MKQTNNKKEEFKKRIKNLGKRKDMIHGIYNYCDRWCEKCTFTSRCANFSIEDELWDDEEKGLENEKFWEKMSMIFEVTAELLMEKAEELGIDLSKAETVDDDGFKKAEKSELVLAAKDYGLAVNKWLNLIADHLTLVAVNDALTDPDNSDELSEATEVIRWYSLFIPAKISRAMSQTNEDPDFQFDMNGSAKIALIALERTIAAFAILYDKLPGREDEILAFLSNLSKIKKEVERKFPEAMNFIRPGFDES